MAANQIEKAILTDKSIIFKLPFLTAGLNGNDGLIRQHFTAAKKVKDKLKMLILSQKPKGLRAIDEPVKVTYIRYASVLCDWDNAAASFKHIGDALTDAGVIIDDSPHIIKEFTTRQIKCKRVDVRTEIIIEFIY